MAKMAIMYKTVLLFLIFEVSSFTVDKACNNGSSLFELEKPGSRRPRENCCPRYKQVTNVTLDTTWVQCVPLCIPACKNGDCQSPGVCACKTGFKPDPDQNHSCVPHCSDGCIHGTCVSPEQCFCNHGYKYDLNEERCQPVCTEPCYNGTCVSPENCQCHPGYRESEANVCQPYCSVGCDHGHCVAPETCGCDYGWGYYSVSETHPGVCRPICFACDGVCVAPDVCIKKETESNSVGPFGGEASVTMKNHGDANESSNTMDNNQNDKIGSDQTNINIIKGSLLFITCLILFIIMIMIMKYTKFLDYVLGRSYNIEDKDDTDLNMESLEK